MSDVVLLEQPEGGTTITWRSRFDARWPLAPLFERGLRTFIADTAIRLSAAAASKESSMVDREPTTATAAPTCSLVRP